MVCIPGVPCGQGGGEKGRRRPGQGSGGGCHLITALRQRNLALVGHQAQETQATLDGLFIPGRDGDCPRMEIAWRQPGILHRPRCVRWRTDGPRNPVPISSYRSAFRGWRACALHVLALWLERLKVPPSCRCHLSDAGFGVCVSVRNLSICLIALK